MGKSIQLKDNEGNLYPVTYTVVSNQYGDAYKFSSGLLICKMRYSVSKTIANAWGNIYISDIFSLPNYPVEYKYLPSVSFSIEGSNSAWIINDGNASLSAPASIRLVRNNQSYSTAKSFLINVLAIGVWK